MDETLDELAFDYCARIGGPCCCGSFALYEANHSPEKVAWLRGQAERLVAFRAGAPLPEED